eukprot:GHVS01066954.1.p1 GENE.GHVS01066954.1~~GHVS01066954.1.p1  ORF type:complete len:257 (+),score=50.97 GHVS01066954.1:336-1106(+)
MEKLEAAMIQAAVPKQPGDGEGLFSSVVQLNGPSSRRRRSARGTRRPAETSAMEKTSTKQEEAERKRTETSAMEKLAAMIQAAVPTQPGDGKGLFSSVFQSNGSASRKKTSAGDTRRPAQAAVPKQSVYGEGIFSSVLQSIGSASRKKTSAGGPRHTPRTWGAMIDNLLPTAVPKQPGDGEGQFRSVIQSNGPRRPSERRVTPMMEQLSSTNKEEAERELKENRLAAIIDKLVEEGEEEEVEGSPVHPSSGPQGSP